MDNTCGKRFEHQLGELPRGYDHKYTYRHLGYNLKMTDLQASVGVAQLARLPGFGAARRANWRRLREALAPLAHLLDLPEPTPDSDPSWFGFMMLVKKDAPFTRDALVQHLEARHIQTRMLFGGNLVRQPALTELAADARARGAPPPFRVVGTLPVTDEVMLRGFWLGVYPGLTEEMVAYVARSILEFGPVAAAAARRTP
jgi:CDP-6-deoxy-D-xylo-4-hexulose-3-dehydrase